MADYGFDPTLPPDIDAGARALKTREMVAQMLMKQGMNQPQGRMVGRFYVPPSPLAGVASAAQMYAGMKSMQDADTAAGELGTKYREGVTNALSNYQQTKSGTPGSDITWNQPTRPDGTGDATTSIPAVAPNPRKAVVDAMTSQYGPVRDLGKLDYAQMNKDPMKVDVGNRVALVKDGVQTSSIPKAASPDATLTDKRTRDLNSTVSANTAATNSTVQRGQDMTDARDRELYGLKGKGDGTTPTDGKIGQLSPMMEIQANAIATGKQPPISSRSGRPSPIMARVMEINPDYDAKDYGTNAAGEKYFTSGKGGQAVKSFNVAHSHLDTLEGLVDAMNNGDTPAINRIANVWKTQTGQTAPNNFETAKKIVGDEIVKAVVGAGGGVADREEAAKSIASWATPAQLKEGIGVYKELMRGQLDGLRGQYEASTGKKDFDGRFLSASVKAELPAPAGAPSVESLLEKYK